MKKIISLVSISLLFLMLSGCNMIPGGNDIPDNPIPGGNDNAATPSVQLDCDDFCDIHYGVEGTLKVNATSSDKGTLSYQWYKGSTTDYEKASPVSGATSDSYKVSGNSESFAYYWCKVTNTRGLTTATSWSDYIAVRISNIVEVSDNIEESTTWNAEYTYLIKNDVWVTNKLTIPAGTVVKFEKDSFLGTENNGIIIAQGTPGPDYEMPDYVIFTAATDNFWGILVPAYKDLTPVAGYWEGLEIKNPGSVFDYCLIEFAGSEFEGAMALSAKTTVTNCVFSDNVSPEGTKYGALNIKKTEGAVKSIIENNLFYCNEWPLSCPANITIPTSNKFKFEPLGMSELVNTHQAIHITSSTISDTDNVTWHDLGLPYYSEDIDVEGTLTIDENVIVRFAEGSSIDVWGKLVLPLKAKLTSYRDDANGGDIFANGTDTAEDDDWEGIWYEDTGYDNDQNKLTEIVLYNKKSNYSEE